MNKADIQSRKEAYTRLPAIAAEDIRNAVETLKQGGVILYPTDTIWGLGCDATNEDAVSRI